MLGAIRSPIRLLLEFHSPANKTEGSFQPESHLSGHSSLHSHMPVLGFTVGLAVGEVGVLRASSVASKSRGALDSVGQVLSTEHE